MESSRVYRVRNDVSGEVVFVTAKNRLEAPKKAGIHYTHVSYCPWLKPHNGRAVDDIGRVWGVIIENTKTSPVRLWAKWDKEGKLCQKEN